MTPAEESVYMRAEGWVENWLEKELEANPESDVCKQNLEQWKVLVQGINLLKAETKTLQLKISNAKYYLS